jgi:opacity protein-like surface antigen
MLNSELLPSSGKFGRLCRSVCVLSLLFALLTWASPALVAQADFTVQMQPFPYPAAVDPGGTSAAEVTVTPESGFNGTVDLSCQVTPQPANYPNCEVSPASVVPPDTATATVTTTGATPAGQYAFAVTGTISGTNSSVSAPPQYLTVLAVAPSFTITVAQAVQPNSVHAGSGGQGTISINPQYGYSGSVTLSCATVTPLVILPPLCSFNPNPVTVSQTGAATSTISINTIGPSPRSAVVRARPLYALWLPLPMLVLAGVGAVRGKRSCRTWCLLALLVVAGASLLMPACGSSSTTTPTNPNGQVTPNNSYTFTVMGVDANGASSSNTGTSAPTVSLTVD